MRKLLTCILMMFLLASGGCAMDPVTTSLAGGATIVSYSVLGKSAVDYGLSKYRQQDCDIRNPKKYDGRYCVDLEETKEIVLEQDKVYCYRSLGDVYCRRDKEPGGSSSLGETTTVHRSDYGSPVNSTRLERRRSNALSDFDSGRDSSRENARKNAQVVRNAQEELEESYRNRPTSILPEPASDPVLHGS